VQGVGAALVMPATLSLITSVFPPQERQRAISIWVGFAGAGGAIGPVVSGALLNHFWWGAAFLVNLPVVAAVATAIAVVAPKSRDDSNTPLDPMGAVFSLIGLGTLLYAIIEGPDRGWTDGLILGAFAVAAITLFAFVEWERRTRHPMLPIRFFSDRRFSTGAAVITSAFFVMFGFFFLFSLYLQFARGYSPLGAGVAALPFAGTMIVVSPRSAALVERIGPGRTIASGLALVSIGMVLLSTISVSSPYLLLVVVMMFLAGGMAITVAPSTGGIMATVPMAKAGVGSAVNDTTRELGGALGIAVFGSIANSAYRAKVDVGGLGLPPAVAKLASESVGAASRVASQLGGAQAAELVRRAGEAYTNAYNVVALVAAVFIGLAALVVLRVLPADKVRAEDVAPSEPAVAVES
jgi:DHA2 family multidrug resistance protein-like MFS transporter